MTKLHIINLSLKEIDIVEFHRKHPEVWDMMCSLHPGCLELHFDDANGLKKKVLHVYPKDKETVRVELLLDSPL